jgi:sulfonate transport system substrate-binding protein
MDRRRFLHGFLGLAAGGAAPSLLARPARADAPKEIRIAYQKAGILPAVKQRRTLETLFAPLNIEIKWNEFAFGPPILESLNTGKADYGFAGNTPPIFAQAARGDFNYVAAAPNQYSEAIVVPDASPLRTIADLKGKKIAVSKASSAHYAIVAALEKADLTFADIKPAYLAPADGFAAFKGGSVDAWSIWDPYLALAQKAGARVISFAADTHSPASFLLANRQFTTDHPELVAKLNDALAVEYAWGDAHRDEVGRFLHEATNVDLDAVVMASHRASFKLQPVGDEIADAQQKIADSFYKLGLIPRQIAVRDVIWTWKPAT